jgi:hypothetical protein
MTRPLHCRCPAPLDFVDQLFLVFSWLMLIAAAIGAHHHDMGSFMAFTFSVFFPLFVWAGETATSWS